jgi:HEAT repeat protein
LFALPPLPRTVAAALRDADSKRPDVRRSAVVDLVRHVDSSERQAVVAALRQSLRSDDDPTIRAMTAIAIADNAITALLPDLLQALEDSEPRVQQMALLALGELANTAETEVIEAIRPLLRSMLPALRYQALVAWRRLAGTAGMTEIVAALDDDDREVRWVAWTLLEESIDQQKPSSSETSTPRYSVAERETLLKTLHSRGDDACMRIWVVGASVLLHLGDPAPMTRLLERVERTSGVSRADLVAITQRFGRLKFEPARKWLARHARRGWFEGALGWPATVALAALGDPAAEQAVLVELDSLSVRRRGRALAAILDLGMVAALDQLKRLEGQASGVDAWLVRETLVALESRQDR